MAAERMADSSSPDTRAGKIRRTMVMNTVEESWISPRYSRPATAVRADMTRIITVQEMPMTLDLRSSFSLLMDMKRMMMWGIPK